MNSRVYRQLVCCPDTSYHNPVFGYDGLRQGCIQFFLHAQNAANAFVRDFSVTHRFLIENCNCVGWYMPLCHVSIRIDTVKMNIVRISWIIILITSRHGRISISDGCTILYSRLPLHRMKRHLIIVISRYGPKKLFNISTTISRNGL